MFTIEQIKAAHSKVKSGADFPAYVQELIQLGVSGYETYVSNGNSIYLGNGGEKVELGAKYASMPVAAQPNHQVFEKELKEHQQGKTDYPTFCAICASTGVEKWIVDLSKMTCSYFDKPGNLMLVEAIPA